MTAGRMHATKRDAESRSIVTTGEVFPDGTIIELVSGKGSASQPNLLLYSKGANTISASTVKHAGCYYRAPRLSPPVFRATRFPARCTEYGSLRKLLTAVSETFQQHLRIHESESKLLASFCLSTWLADRLPTAPRLLLVEPDGEQGINALRLMSCFCRRPLVLGELTPESFRRLPMNLRFTLLIRQSGINKKMQRLLQASSHKGLHILGSRGTILDAFCPKAILAGPDQEGNILGDDAIQVCMEPAEAVDAIDERLQRGLADKFQSRLLMYRLTNCAKVHMSRTEAQEFAPATRQLASILAACLGDDPALAKEVVSLLTPQDEDLRSKQAGDIVSAVVRVLLGSLHEGKLIKMSIQEITRLANHLRRSSGQTLEYSPEEVGWKLKSLNLRRHRTNAGSVLMLDPATSFQVHRLARFYGLSGKPGPEGCPECAVHKGDVAG